MISPPIPALLRATALVAIIAVAAACPAADPTTDMRPTGSLEDIRDLANRADLNVLFILVDTLRADRLGAYGYERSTSPVIDELARTGLRFENHVAQSSWTKCSMASLWTGAYPNRTGVLHAQHAISEAATLPAEIFREEGFRTAGIWRNGWIAPNFGFGQGFELYFNPSAIQPGLDHSSHPEKVGVGDGDVIRSANVFMRTHQLERWFLYLHLMDVHQYSYDTESAVFGTAYSDNYDNSILWTDKLLGYLIEELDRLGLRDRTILVLVGDHGEAFGEHGGEGHARNVYGEVTQTPFIVSFPFRLEPGLVVQSRTENVDVWPTLLELLDLPSLADPDGESLVETVVRASQAGTQAQAEDLAVAHLDAGWARQNASDLPLVALNRGRWRLIYDARIPERPQLFDKQEDPKELRDLASQRPEVTADLIAAVGTYLDRKDSPWGGGEAPIIEIDDMQLQHLRAIGYGL